MSSITAAMYNELTQVVVIDVGLDFGLLYVGALMMMVVV